MDDLIKHLKPKEKRKKSIEQERKLAKKHGGKTTFNSGATLGENDIETPKFSIEAKITEKKGYRITVEEFEKIEVRTRNGKIPIQIIEFSKLGKELLIINKEDFFALID